MAVLLLAGATSAWSQGEAEDEGDLTISRLMKDGWQVAGYTSTVDNRSTFILFRHPDHAFLVQCRAGYDVTRSPRVFSNCYQLR